MILSNRWLWTACAILCLALLPSACSPQPTAGIPPSVGVEPVDDGNPNMTQREATETVTIALPLRTEQPGTTGLPPTRPASQPLLTQVAGSALSEVPEELLEVVLADLARRLDLKPEEIDIVEVERVTWPDTSLGCPQPGRMYAQVLTPGYRLVLEAGGQTYQYHTDRSRSVVFCDQETIVASTATPWTTAAPETLPDIFLIYPILNPHLATPAATRSSQSYQEDVIQAVTTDLARRLAAPADTLHLVTSGYLEIAVTSPCGTGTVKEEARPSAGGLMLGFEVLLEAEGTHHRYIAVGGLAHYCGPQ